MTEIQDYTKAREILAEYPSRDGLHVDSLLDSDKHGALTYNDSLILPGSISMRTPKSIGLLYLTYWLDFPAFDITLDIKVTRQFTIKAPLLSSPMDTITRHNIGYSYGSPGIPRNHP